MNREVSKDWIKGVVGKNSEGYKYKKRIDIATPIIMLKLLISPSPPPFWFLCLRFKGLVWFILNCQEYFTDGISNLESYSRLL